MRKEIFSPALIFAFIAALAVGSLAAAAWEKYVSPDGSISFHYPQGWKVETDESVITIANPAADEEILIVGIPYDRKKTPTALAKEMVALLATGAPDLKAFGWTMPAQEADTAVSFEMTYTDRGNRIVPRASCSRTPGPDGRHWFSFSGPAAGYSRPRALEILQGVVGSLAAGSSSRPPAPAVPALDPAQAKKNEENGRAFLFVLEFALGAPFTSAQEGIILGELQAGWSNRTAQELKPYDAYPQYVNLILSLDQKRLEELRQELEKTVRAWLAESPRSDPAVQAVQAQLREKGRVLIAGDPPLTEMTAVAYAEMYAYAELLQADPRVAPDRIAKTAVQEIRGQLVRAWLSFSPAERKEIATSPGLWICLRTLVSYGSTEEKESVRTQLKKLAAGSAPAAAGTSTGVSAGAGGRSLTSPVAHTVMLQMQQMTFNQYLWSRGFTSTIYGW